MIYLDYQSTTPCDRRVLNKMLPFFCEIFGNAHSSTHAFGWEAEDAVKKARAQIANLIGAEPKDIIFTSGATESNNLALKGSAFYYKKKHIITCVTEHKCILETCRYLEMNGFDVTYLPVQKNGLVDLKTLESAITDETFIVSIMSVNNEVGVIQPLKEIGEICKKHDVLFHTDAAQAFGKIPLDVDEMGIDMLSISGHKIYGPKGVGALYVRKKPRRVRLIPLIHGGGQERGMRSGTLPVSLCVGLGEAAEIAGAEMETESKRLSKMTNYFYTQVTNSLDKVFLNGDLEKRVPGSLNLSFSCVEGEGLMMKINNLAVSSGSACTSASLEPSYVLKATGISEDLAHTSIRFGFGRFTTQEDIETAIESLVRAVKELRSISPLWEMQQEGIDINSIQWKAH